MKNMKFILFVLLINTTTISYSQTSTNISHPDDEWMWNGGGIRSELVISNVFTF